MWTTTAYNATNEAGEKSKIQQVFGLRLYYIMHSRMY